MVTVFSRVETSAGSRWRSYLTSGMIHAGVIALLLIIPVVEWQELPAAPPARVEKIVLQAPPPITIRAPRSRRTATPPPPVIAKRSLKLPPVVRNPEPKVVAKMKLPPVPIIAPKPAPVLPQIAELRPAPAPVVRNPAPVLKPDIQQVKVGGFGDPNGIKPSRDDLKSPVMMAKLGAFDMPHGAGNSAGSGRSGASLRTTAFGTGGFGEGGTGTGGGANGVGSGGALKVGGFGEQQAAGNQPALAQAAVPATSPVVILYKPKPAYTAEAERLHLEGEAALEVVFSASGTVRVVRVVHGLGHGLDREAERAAMEIRFRPATRGGSPVDTTAMVRILFQLA